jgi:hypothetical protein
MTRDQLLYAQMGSYVAQGLKCHDALLRAEQYISALEFVAEAAAKLAARDGGVNATAGNGTRQLPQP